MSTNNNLTRAQKRERALRAIANVHPSHLRTRRVRPGSPVASAIKVATERHTQAVAAMHQIANAPMPVHIIDLRTGTCIPSCPEVHA